MDSRVNVNTNVNRNNNIKNFLDIKDKLENTKKSIDVIYNQTNGTIKNNIEVIRNLIKIQLNITNDYIKKLDKINKEFDIMTDRYIKELNKMKNFNIKSIRYK